jgi:hypothetical protein
MKRGDLVALEYARDWQGIVIGLEFDEEDETDVRVLWYRGGGLELDGTTLKSDEFAFNLVVLNEVA